MKKLAAITCTLLIISAALPQPALAAHGTPNSPQFGYGLHVDVYGAHVENVLHKASAMGLDWVALDFDWSNSWPDPAKWDETSSFGRAARLADTLGLNLVFSISNPPDWAKTAQGPHPSLTAALLCDLKKLFPNLQAVELYPRANTISGWGVAPDAKQYANLLTVVQERIIRQGLSIYLLSGGLSNHLDFAEDISDIDFLQALYDAGQQPAIISLRLDQLHGDVLDAPTPNSLRHFEQIRAVMIANHASDDLLWVTGFTIPQTLSDSALSTQTDWLTQAYLMMRSRLYFGSAFYSCYNASGILDDQICLVHSDGSEHPFLARLRILIGEN